MSHHGSGKKHRCTLCQEHDTASPTRICWRCRPIPHVEVRGDLVHVQGLWPMSTEKALQLAHRLADVLTP